MITAGVDIGSRTAKVIILRDGEMLSSSLISTGPESAATANLAMDIALNGTGITLDDIEYIIATGYGRYIAPFANGNVSEISCHAKGINWLFPSVRTILDMGGQDCKAIRIDRDGNHIKFLMNDKCAAGTGRFLDVMADALRVPLDDIGRLSLQSKSEASISSTCTVFARTEVFSLVRKGVSKEDILAGLHTAIASRVFSLLQRVGIEADFAICGGIAKNIGVVRKVEERVGLKALIPQEPQLSGALGAALIAAERYTAKVGSLASP